jgi:hypothetical protein
MKFRRNVWLICGVMVFAVGCDAQKSAEKPAPQSIIGQTTQDIGQYDPDAGEEVSDGKIEMNLVTGAAGAYGPMIEKVSNIAVVQAVNLFNGFHGRYPKDHEEFMAEVIKKNNIRLPMLPHGSAYKYDVENHALVVVKVNKDGGDQR